MELPKNPIYFFCDVPPRKLSPDQLQAITSLMVQTYDWTFDEAWGLLQSSYVAVFPKTKRFLLRQKETTIIVKNMNIYIFSWLGGGKVELKNIYRAE